MLPAFRIAHARGFQRAVGYGVCCDERRGRKAGEEGNMRRFVGVAIAVAVLGAGAAACTKAHNAGNDSMSVGSGRIVAAGG